MCIPTNMMMTEPIVATKWGYQFVIPVGNGVKDCCVVHFFGNFHGDYSSHARTRIRSYNHTKDIPVSPVSIREFAPRIPPVSISLFGRG